jgi:membrane protein DedA with SNARE-associated domain
MGYSLTGSRRKIMLGIDLGTIFLSAMTTAGPAAFALALFLGPLGLPIPTGLLVVAAGAFVRQGLMPLGVAVGLGLAATLSGDATSYLLGRFAGGWAQRLGKGRRAAGWQRAREQFKRRGGLALYATRVLLTALDVPANLIAGGSGYGFRRFLAWDVAGRVTWLLLYGGLGYLFCSQWQAVTALLSSYGIWLGLAAGAAFLLAQLIRRLRRARQASQAGLCGQVAS